MVRPPLSAMARTWFAFKAVPRIFLVDHICVVTHVDGTDKKSVLPIDEKQKGVSRRVRHAKHWEIHFSVSQFLTTLQLNTFAQRTLYTHAVKSFSSGSNISS